jgi:glucose/arabinose dehydrogenase
MTTYRRPLLIGAVILIVLGAGAHAGYTYLVEKPPSFLIQLVTKTPPPPPLPEGEVAPFMVPEGFAITIVSREVPHARVLVRDPKGTLLVSQAGKAPDGKVVALPDLDGNGIADSVVTVLSGLNDPHGISVVCPDTGNASADQDGCRLFVAEEGRLVSYAYDADTYTATDQTELATFPTGSGHFTRTLLPSPDLKSLFVSIGSSCNVCIESNPLRATIQTFELATHKLSTVATGLRNSVFMATNPVTGELWATDNGRDLIGDDIPPDEVNIIRQGANYGWPLCYGNNIYDTSFDKDTSGSPCSTTTPPHIALPAHVAALGLAFVPEEGWPDEWGNDLLVALHGSWNRSVPSGYKVVRVHLDDQGNQVGELQDVVTGFLPAGSKDKDDAIGRPVGLLAEPGGVLYITDDRQGAVYRVSLIEPAR